MTGRPTRIDTLTPAQRARMASFAQEWIDRGWRTQPLTEEEWAVWEQGARRCYEYAGIPWPGVVVRVPSPIVGAFAAPLAAYEIARIKGCTAVGTAVGTAVRTAVGTAVDTAVDTAVRTAVDTIRKGYYRCFGGRTGGGYYWSGWWQSYIAYFRDICELHLDGDLWDRSRAFDDTQTAGWWWPFRDFVMVCDVPTIMHLEQVGGEHRLHCEDGPAVAWADGWGVYVWHGVTVPKDLIEDGWSTDRILKEPNAEIRRCAIEHLGWDRFVTDAGLTQVGKAVADPGNPGHHLTLHDVPSRIYGEPVRVLLCTNATPERDGTRRRFGLTVPAHIADPIAASAWTFDLNPDQYRALERAT